MEDLCKSNIFSIFNSTKLIFFILPMQNGKYPPVTNTSHFAETKNRKQLFHIHRLMKKKGQYVSTKLVYNTVRNSMFLKNETMVCTNRQKWKEIPLIRIFHYTDQKMLCTWQNTKKDLVHFTPVFVFLQSHVNCEFDCDSKWKNPNK